MQQVVVITWCDYPGCAEKAQEAQKIGPQAGQEVGNVDFWVNAFGGRKTKPIKVVLCGEHKESLKTLFSEMAKYDQHRKAGAGDDDSDA